MAQGWFQDDLPEAEYHGMHDRLSCTGIKAILRAPSIFAEYQANGRPPKDSFDLGSVAHTLVLGTGWELSVWDGDSWAGKEAQAHKAKAYAENKIPIKAEDHAQVVAMRQRLAEHPAGKWFEDGAGISEVSLFWTDPESGVDCRARVDRLTLTDDGRPLIIDYKTTRDASPHNCRSDVAKFRYYVQQPFYQDGMVGAGLDPEGVAEFRFVFQEKTAPYPVTVVRLAGTAVWQGRQEIRKALNMYAACMKSGVWPDYADDEIEVDLPRWKYYEQEQTSDAY